MNTLKLDKEIEWLEWAQNGTNGIEEREIIKSNGIK